MGVRQPTKAAQHQGRVGARLGEVNRETSNHRAGRVVLPSRLALNKGDVAAPGGARTDGRKTSRSDWRSVCFMVVDVDAAKKRYDLRPCSFDWHAGQVGISPVGPVEKPGKSPGCQKIARALAAGNLFREMPELGTGVRPRPSAVPARRNDGTRRRKSRSQYRIAA